MIEEIKIQPPEEQEQISQSFEEEKMIENEGEMVDSPLSIPLQTDKEGNLNFYWIDIYENQRNYPGKLFLFGKVYVARNRNYESICVVVKNMKRLMYFIPTNAAATGEDIIKIDKEIENLRRMRFKSIKSWLRRPVDKKYAFELDIKKGKQKVLEVMYDFKYQPLPRDLRGKSFSHVIGTTYSPIEIFLILLKIKGPCWLKIPVGKYVQAVKQRHSRCK